MPPRENGFSVAYACRSSLMKKSQREDVPQRSCEVVYGKNIPQDP
jgi:hypothetical protein